MNMFKRLWNTLFYTFASDEAYYKKHRVEDTPKGRVLAVVQIDEPVAKLLPYEGRTALTVNGNVIKTYARRSDALRGAQRQGLKVAA